VVRCDLERLQPGQLVVAELRGIEALATVILAREQLVENEAGARPMGRVLRPASDDDVRAFGRAAAEPLATAASSLLAASAGDRDLALMDAWLAPDGARLFVVCRGEILDAASLAAELTRHLGLPVELAQARADGAPQVVSGVVGAGLPTDWDAWLVPPEASSALFDLGRSADAPTAQELIERLFPLAERGEPRARGRRRSAAGHEEADDGKQDSNDAEQEGRGLRG
jgi:hypothetical protein